MPNASAPVVTMVLAPSLVPALSMLTEPPSVRMLPPATPLAPSVMRAGPVSASAVGLIARLATPPPPLMLCASTPWDSRPTVRTVPLCVIATPPALIPLKPKSPVMVAPREISGTCGAWP